VFGRDRLSFAPVLHRNSEKKRTFDALPDENGVASIKENRAQRQGLHP
jgi:hypothetical protein